MDVWTTFKCDTCGRPLDFKVFKPEQQKYSTSITFHIEVCDFCVSDAKEKALEEYIKSGLGKE